MNRNIIDQIKTSEKYQISIHEYNIEMNKKLKKL